LCYESGLLVPAKQFPAKIVSAVTYNMFSRMYTYYVAVAWGHSEHVPQSSDKIWLVGTVGPNLVVDVTASDMFCAAF